MSEILQVLAAAGFDVSDATVEPLKGGISCTTELVRLKTGDVVVKQALAQLLVAADWRADPARTIAEGLGLAWFHERTPQVVPRPLAIIENPPTLVIPMAPEPCPNWREQLLAGPTQRDVVIAAQLRGILDTWRAAPFDDARGTALDDLTWVTDLRIDAFYLRMAALWPEFADSIESLADELREQQAMTHGDFTPKNVLCLNDGVWVIDAEITHIGNPILDIASMTSHLLLKSLVHRTDPIKRAVMTDIRRAFTSPEFDGVSSLPGHVGVILGVRSVGVSPAPYLDEPTRRIATEFARNLLAGASLADVEGAI